MKISNDRPVPGVAVIGGQYSEDKQKQCTRSRRICNSSLEALWSIQWQWFKNFCFCLNEKSCIFQSGVHLLWSENLALCDYELAPLLRTCFVGYAEHQSQWLKNFSYVPLYGYSSPYTNFTLFCLDAFAKLRKATIRFVMSVRLFAWNSVPTRRIFMKLDIWIFWEKLWRKFQFH